MFETDDLAFLEGTEDSTLFKLVVLPCVAGFLFLFGIMICFALAVGSNWTDDVAPRIANRPKDVLKNAMCYHTKEQSWTTKKWFYPLAWITWAYKLTYQECLLGIPGTGTRKNGWEGPLLKTNLDAIILLRFHGFMFKVAFLAAILFGLVILPLNATAPCDIEVLGVGTCYSRSVTASTDYLKTTIANIPLGIYNNVTGEVVVGGFDAQNVLNFNRDTISGIEINVTDVVNGTDDLDVLTEGGNPIDPAVVVDTGATPGVKVFDYPPAMLRVTTIVVCCSIIYIYTMILLVAEWRACIALRRKYFLEMAHYSHRMVELNRMLLRREEKLHRPNNDDDDDDVRFQELPQYFTHPEIRETPPSIGVFSVLFQLPKSMVTYDTEGKTTVERQLVATRNFFDEIIPPQEGFSSSVAAVTILPNASLLAKAWQKWTVCEQKLQKLRYIRKEMAIREKERRRYEDEYSQRMAAAKSHSLQISKVKETPESSSSSSSQRHGKIGSPRRKKDVVAQRIAPDGSVESISSNDTNSARHHVPLVSPEERVETERQETFQYEKFNVSKYARLLGFSEEVDDMGDFVEGMGIEEFDVFAHECASLATGPLFDKRIYRLYSLETLREDEEALIAEIQIAQDELNQAREAVAAKADDVELSSEEPSTMPVLNLQDVLDDIKDYGRTNNIGNGRLGLRQRRVSAGSPFDSITIEVDHAKEPTEERRKGQTFTCGVMRFVRLVQRIFAGSERIDADDKKYYGTQSEDGKGKGYVTNLERPSFAVVTFTCRQAALIARQCLPDGGGGQNVWQQVDQIPIYPLADGPPSMFGTRGLSRPVTMNISYSNKKLRRWLIYTFSVLFTILNVYVVNRINDFILHPEALAAFFGITLETASSISSTVSGATQAMLFSAAPFIFLQLAYREGSSSSVETAERKALVFFWYFYMIARFMGQILVEAFLDFFRGESVDTAFNTAATRLIQTIPTTLGPSALSIIIYGFTLTWPAFYFFPIINYGTTIFRLKFLNRMMKGGGLGSEVPYRIYVDSGYVFLCMMALGPFCPVIGPFALLYFVVVAPMLRWVIVFGYRPKFDGGGDKWPKLHHMIISSLLVSQIIGSVMLIAKYYLFAGVFLGACTIPTLLYNNIILDNYLRSYQESALLQTSRMYRKYHDDSDTAETDSEWAREEYRRWLVDCHKASYVPTCLSGSGTNIITAEPAVVLSDATESCQDEGRRSVRTLRLKEFQKTQKGGILHRQKYNT